MKVCSARKEGRSRRDGLGCSVEVNVARHEKAVTGEGEDVRVCSGGGMELDD